MNICEHFKMVILAFCIIALEKFISIPLVIYIAIAGLYLFLTHKNIITKFVKNTKKKIKK